MSDRYPKKKLPEFIGPPQLLGEFALRKGEAGLGDVDGYNMLVRPLFYDVEDTGVSGIEAASENPATFYVAPLFTEEAVRAADQGYLDDGITLVSHSWEQGPFSEKRQAIGALKALGADVPEDFDF